MKLHATYNVSFIEDSPKRTAILERTPAAVACPDGLPDQLRIPAPLAVSVGSCDVLVGGGDTLYPGHTLFLTLERR